jgi:predicted nucleotide-binding protein
MARRKAPQPEHKGKLELATALDEAENKITERIAKGREIRETPINSPQDLDSAEKIYGKWNDFNVELLKRIFTNDELSEEYTSWAGSIVMFSGEKSLGKKVSDFYEEIDEKIHRLESMAERLELIPESSAAPQKASDLVTERKIDKSKIFIVHGHDDSAKLEVARFIEKIGFKPIILHEQASGSKTIIEKIEAYSDVGFGVVIYSPCDLGSKNIDPPVLSGRARQNVVFEHGFLIGKLGRSKVCSLVKGNVETPNDISGIVYTSMDSSNWQIELAKELRAAGYPVDMNNVI